MNTPTKLRKKDIPACLLAVFPGYKGRKFKAYVTTRVCSISGLNWSGGSRSTFRLVRLEDGAGATVPGNQLSPFNNPCEGESLDIPSGFVCVEHSMFCGKDSGLTFHVHPDNVSKLIRAE